MAQLLDLRTTPYRWKWSDDHEPGMRYDPYHVRLMAKYGTVHVAGDDLLGVWVTTPIMLSKVESIPGVVVVQRGDREGIARFRPSLLEAVGKVVGLRKKHTGLRGGQIPSRWVWVG